MEFMDPSIRILRRLHAPGRAAGAILSGLAFHGRYISGVNAGFLGLEKAAQDFS
jgi:hypothetical protein